VDTDRDHGRNLQTVILAASAGTVKLSARMATGTETPPMNTVLISGERGVAELPPTNL